MAAGRPLPAAHELVDHRLPAPTVGSVAVAARQQAGRDSRRGSLSSRSRRPPRRSRCRQGSSCSAVSPDVAGDGCASPCVRRRAPGTLAGHPEESLDGSGIPAGRPRAGRPAPCPLPTQRSVERAWTTAPSRNGWNPSWSRGGPGGESGPCPGRCCQWPRDRRAGPRQPVRWGPVGASRRGRSPGWAPRETCRSGDPPGPTPGSPGGSAVARCRSSSADHSR